MSAQLLGRDAVKKASYPRIRTVADLPKVWRLMFVRQGHDRTAAKLRDDAYYAHLDGRDAQARKFHHYADIIDTTPPEGENHERDA